MVGIVFLDSGWNDLRSLQQCSQSINNFSALYPFIPRCQSAHKAVLYSASAVVI
jgi:hypothetical protein